MRAFARCLLVLAALTQGSCFLRTGKLLDVMNEPSTAEPSLPRTPPLERVARLARTHLVDAYLDPARVGAWMASLGESPGPLLELTACLAAQAGTDNSSCYLSFTRAAVLAPAWGVPALPTAVDSSRPAEAEVDAARFLANAMGIGPSLVALKDSLLEPLDEEALRRGLRQGAQEAREYLLARAWKRTLGRPSNAVVVSGGAANGAFAAGLLWRLLGVLERCRGTPQPEGCADARIDLAVGTSTGTLIGALVDLFHTPGQERVARELLLGNYTCSVESDLYCVNSTWVWKLAQDVRGLVRFDGIQRKMKESLVVEQLRNPTELVAMSVDFGSGDVFSISDQNPADFAPGASEAQRLEGLIDGIMASIVEPVLAEPVDAVPSRGGPRRGTYVDGGVRTGLPVLQAMQLGAERVLVISTAGLEPGPSAQVGNAVQLLMRTISLFVAQPRVGEVQQAELAAVTRRLAEYNVCRMRLEEGDSPAEGDVPEFCSRRGAGFDPPVPAQLEGAVSMWLGPARLEQVSSSWRTAWVYRPESTLTSAGGYGFNPAVMRPLFEQGVALFQARCRELLQLFQIGGRLAAQACSEPAEQVIAQLPYAPLETCTAKPERRTCP